jgi:hypothetical protein
MNKIKMIIVAVAAMFAASMLVAPPASAEYGGYRWATKSGPICVQYKGIKSSAVRSAVKESVVNMHQGTTLWLRYRYDCSGYAKRILVYDGWYGKNGHLAWTQFKGGFSWGPVPTKGPWTYNGHTWRIKSPVVIKINKSYWLSFGRRSSAASHELGHAVGLGHNNRCASTLQSSMYWAERRGCTIYRNLTWRDRVGYWTSDPGINQIYRYG